MTIDLDGLKAYWGKELVTVPAELLRDASIPADQAVFLTQTGLPARNTLPLPVFPNSSDFKIWTHLSRPYLVIADEHDQRLCVGLDDGAVVALDARGELADRPVNSDAIRLAVFLTIYAETLPQLSAASDEEPAQSSATCATGSRKSIRRPCRVKKTGGPSCSNRSSRG
ncbi:MAG: hypothetical protein HC850_03815 [Rhodomicrobium sp.]|nr:hypothetical protein [Rhodomicrobium sp.]